MLVNVKTFLGEIIQIESNPSDTIYSLKEKIFHQEGGTIIDNQKLIFKSEELKNDKKLADYGLFDGVVIYLVVRMIKATSISTEQNNQNEELSNSQHQNLNKAESNSNDKIFICLSYGEKPIYLFIDKNAKVSELKEKLRQQTQIEGDIILIFGIV